MRALVLAATHAHAIDQLGTADAKTVSFAERASLRPHDVGSAQRHARAAAGSCHPDRF